MYQRGDGGDGAPGDRVFPAASLKTIFTLLFLDFKCKKYITSKSIHILGAIFLDSDYLTVSSVVLKLYKDLLNDASPEDSLKDFKTQLQELLQKKGYSLPQYELIKTKGQDHDVIFYVRCIVSEYDLEVEREAKSIKRAEQACAEFLLERLVSS